MHWQQVACLLAATTGLVSAADKPKKEPKDTHPGYGPYPKPQGKEAAPFPNSYYEGADEEYTAAGAKSNQKSPPMYPSPWMDGSGEWSDAYARLRSSSRT